MQYARIIALVLACFVVAAQPASAAGAAGSKERVFLIDKGDQLSVQVWGEDALGGDVVVLPDGTVSLPGIGVLKVAGMTTAQLEKLIANKLTSLVYNPMVSVVVRNFNNNSVIVHGQGVRPAVIALTGKTTLLQILSMVAPEDKADLVNAYLERNGARVAQDFELLFRKGEAAPNPEVLAGDRLFIPLRENRLIFVEGAVGKPSSFAHYEGMTVLEAIHLAGGFTKFADRNDTSVLRQGPGGQERIRVRLGDLTERGDFSQNIVLQGGDLIIVNKGWF